MAGPVNMDVNPLVLLFLPDPRLFRVNGVRHVISDTDNSQRRLISLPLPLPFLQLELQLRKQRMRQT